MQTTQDCIKYMTPEHGHMFEHMQLVLRQSKCMRVASQLLFENHTCYIAKLSPSSSFSWAELALF